MTGDEKLSAVREALVEPLRESAAPSDIDGAVLTGYVVIAEWSDATGRKWITKTAGDINDDGPPTWTVAGWLKYAIDTVFDTGDEDDA